LGGVFSPAVRLVARWGVGETVASAPRGGML
jgi:hypothetical protein